jgi:acetate kinase
VRVLIANAGSSSLKLAVIGDHDEALAERELEWDAGQLGSEKLRAVLDELPAADAVGHRIVHGGERYREAVRVDAEVLGALRELGELAPLHQPRSLAALEAISTERPELPAVACFDTSFHATIPAAAASYALPAAWRERWPLRRFGFHGLSHAWVARRAPELSGKDPDGLRIVSAHLGAGASLCAIAGGRSLDTTMGFTPLEGLVMATRSGSVDPGLVLWLAERLGREALARGLERESGLLGLAGTADMREVLARSDAGEQAATLALETYLHRLRGAIAAMAAALGGIDVLAFTGGVGEHAAAVRARAARGIEFLGVSLDDARNAAAAGDADISANGAGVRSVVVTAREDLEIARQTRRVIGA